MPRVSGLLTAPASALVLLLAPVLVLSLPGPALAGSGQGCFDEHFTGQTMRLDYNHAGTATEEHLCLDQVRVESEWPGSRTQLLDHTNLGKYLLVVVDPATQTTLYSRGFASIYGEWETTGEAHRGVWRSFHESQRFPEPRRPVQVLIKKRAADGTFREIFSAVVDPASRQVNRARPTPVGELWTVSEGRDPATSLDLLILGDGYTAAERDRFRNDADRAASAILGVEPFASHREAIAVRALLVPSAEPGISEPRAGEWRSSPLGLSYNAFDSERYMLTFDNRSLREIAAQAPYDALLLLANSRKYGGGGIFNLWATAAAGSAQLEYLVVHELGHSFAGLGDEYYTSPTSYEEATTPGTEPWEPNITALADPEHLKWRRLVAPGTPIPTPWDQEAYDELALAYQRQREQLRAEGAGEARMEELFAEIKQTTGPMLASQEHAGEVGAFEGAGYQARGLYRPAIDCIMFTRNPDHYCPVCTDAIERVIRLYVD
jgi:hypothetical protein